MASASIAFDLEHRDASVARSVVGPVRSGLVPEPAIEVAMCRIGASEDSTAPREDFTAASWASIMVVEGVIAAPGYLHRTLEAFMEHLEDSSAAMEASMAALKVSMARCKLPLIVWKAPSPGWKPSSLRWKSPSPGWNRRRPRWRFPSDARQPPCAGCMRPRVAVAVCARWEASIVATDTSEPASEASMVDMLVPMAAKDASVARSCLLFQPRGDFEHRESGMLFEQGHDPRGAFPARCRQQLIRIRRRLVDFSGLKGRFCQRVQCWFRGKSWV
jgi:hypothetical protein